MAAGQRLRGFVGQGMDGRRKRPAVNIVYANSFTSGSGVIAVTERSRAYVWLIGGGGAGRDSTGGNAPGGGGGGALYAEIPVNAGQSLAYSIGAGGSASGAGGGAGGDTTLIVNGVLLNAGGGRGGSATAGAGGVATGGLRNYRGGAGGAPGSAGSAGENGGGAGGAGSSTTHGCGGGAANPGAIPSGIFATNITVGAGSKGNSSGASSAGGNYGAGSGGGNNSSGDIGVGAGGAALIILAACNG
jgi:hypothetical protein